MTRRLFITWIGLMGIFAGSGGRSEEVPSAPQLMLYTAQPGARATFFITVFGILKREWEERTESLEIKATLNYGETVTKSDGINVELKCRLRGRGQAGNPEEATSSPLNLKWPVRMKRSGKEVQIPILEKHDFPQIPELAVVLLFNETTRLLAFADRPVREGESWTSHLELRTRNATIPVEVSSKFVGRRTYRGYRCAVLESRFEGQLLLSKVEMENISIDLQGEQKGSLVTLFGLDQGQVVRSAGHVDIKLWPQTTLDEKPGREEKASDPPQAILLEFQFVRELQEMQIPGKPQ